MGLPPRNDVIGFATRTRKNLEAIQNAHGGGDDVHVVAQVANSLLGLVVFPWVKEEPAIRRIGGRSLDTFVDEDGKSLWQILQGEPESRTLADLVYHLRNAVAHGHVTFSSESRELDEVEIEVADHRPHTPKPYWRASIRADRLKTFCLKLIELLENA